VTQGYRFRQAAFRGQAGQRAGEQERQAEQLLADAMLDNAALKDLRCYAEDATLTLMGTTPEI
jgi:hypothetical protein